MHRSPHWFFTLSICALFLVPTPGVAITISPPLIEVTLEPGEAYNRTIRVYNEGAASVHVYPEVVAVADTDSGELEFVTPVNPDSASITEWIGHPAAFDLNVGAWVDVPFTINIPSDAAPGTAAAAVLFTSTPIDEDGTVTVLTRTGPVVLITVAGGAPATGRITEFAPTDSVLGGGVYDAVPQNFVVRTQNTGSVVFIPQGSITVQDTFGRTVATMGVNDDGRRVLPAWTRSFEGTSAGELPENGFLREWQALGLGRYQAQVNVRIGEAEHQARITFWVVPWRTLSLAAVGLLAFIIAVRARRKVSL